MGSNSRKSSRILAVLSILPAGCGGAGFNLDVRVPVEQQTLVQAAEEATPLTVALPADRPFAIHIKRSSQEPGAEGRARGESDATPAGNAFCAAEAAGGGSATAEFALGHRIDNRSAAPQAVSLEVEFELRHALGLSSSAETGSTAKAELALLVIDSRKRIVARMALVQADSEAAEGAADTRDQRLLNARFEPMQTYDVILSGRVEATSAPAQEVSARLEMAQLRMTLTLTAVQTQPAGN